jgi:hypothetical protein
LHRRHVQGLHGGDDIECREARHIDRLNQLVVLDAVRTVPSVLRKGAGGLV